MDRAPEYESGGPPFESVYSYQDAHEYRKASLDAYYAAPSLCQSCGGIIRVSPGACVAEAKKHKFCSHHCAAVFNNKRFPKRKRKSEDRKCLACQGLLKHWQDGFCCQHCHQEYRYRIFVSQWLAGTINVSVCRGMRVSGAIKRYCLERAGGKCERCGWHEVNPFTGRIPIQTHHKDGDSENNKPDNIEILCPSCHALTETFGSRNRGRGRLHRRLLYKQGKIA